MKAWLAAIRSCLGVCPDRSLAPFFPPDNQTVLNVWLLGLSLSGLAASPDVPGAGRWLTQTRPQAAAAPSSPTTTVWQSFLEHSSDRCTVWQSQVHLREGLFLKCWCDPTAHEGWWISLRPIPNCLVHWPSCLQKSLQSIQPIDNNKMQEGQCLTC